MLIVCLSFRLWITGMEPDELERYLERKEQCIDIATEIFPHYKDMYPCGVKEMTALDQELSAAPLTVKIRWCVKKIEGLLKLQSRITSSATGNVQPPVSGNVQPPSLHPQHSSSARAHPVQPISPMPPVSMQRIASDSDVASFSCLK